MVGPSSADKPELIRYRADIDGLRAIAVTSVVFFHAGLFPFSSGFVGVDLFFVISGYLIGEIIFRDVVRGEFSYLRFYARRARRILPALFFVVSATCLLGALLLSADEYRDVGITGTLALVGASNINFWQFQNYFTNDSQTRVFLMTWSLGVEEQFYVVFPLIVILICRYARRWLVEILSIVALASFLLSLWWTTVSPISAFYLLPARAWELGAGVLLAAVETGHARGWRSIPAPSSNSQNVLAIAALVALIASITCFDEHTPFPGFLALLPVFGAGGLILTPDSQINRWLLGNPAAVFVGRVSYSWYLWHWPMMSMLRIIATKTLPTHVFVGVTIASFLVAILSWRFVEQPFRRVRSRPGVTLLRYGLALVAMVSVTAMINVTRGLPIRLTPEGRQIGDLMRTARKAKCLVTVGSALGVDPDCYPSPEDKRPILAITGDSHAWALSSGMRELAERQGFALAIFARSSCPPLEGVSVRIRSDPNNFPKECRDFTSAVRHVLVSDARVRTVILAGFWSAPAIVRGDDGYVPDPGSPLHDDNGLTLLRAGLQAAIATLRGAGKDVVLVQDVPSLPINPGAIALAKAIPLRRFFDGLLDADMAKKFGGTLEARDVPRHEDIARTIGEIGAHNHLRVIDPFSRFCDRLVCRYALGDNFLYFDKDHLTPAGALYALDGMRFGAK